MKERWSRFMVSLVLAFGLMCYGGLAQADTVDPPPGSMWIVSGSLAGQPIGPDSTTVRVGVGETISGTMVVEVANWNRPGALFPVGWTPTWGSHADVYRAVTWHHHGTATFSIPVDLTAPLEPGDYYIFIAGNWQIGVDMLMSSTQWRHLPGPIWDDGNDVADWGEENYQLADLQGWCLYNLLYHVDEYILDASPAAGIKVIVGCPDDADGDGVCDADDLCPDTPQFAIDAGVIGEDGCVDCDLLAEYVDDEVPPEGEYRNHGDYVSQAARIVDEYLEAGLVTEECASDIMHPIAQSDVGKPAKGK